MAYSQKKLGQIAEILFLSITWISALSSLARADFNFAYGLFCYYLWISREDKANTLMLMIMTSILILVDLIWIMTVGLLWDTWIPNDYVWNSLRGVHKFSLLCSYINVIIKVSIVGVLYLYKKGQGNLIIQLLILKEQNGENQIKSQNTYQIGGYGTQ